MAEIVGQHIETTVAFEEDDLESGISLDTIASLGLRRCHNLCLQKRTSEKDERPCQANVGHPSNTRIIRFVCKGFENGCDVVVLGGEKGVASPTRVAAEYIINKVEKIQEELKA